MIKLIASDLDGTLFKPHGVLPDETFNLIERLYEKGITFAPASGRQLPNLLQIFKPVLDKIAIIAENGGVVWRGGKVIYSNLMPQREVVRALDAVSKADGLYPLLSCADCAYYQDDNPKFVQTVKNSYTVCKRVENLKSISGEVGTVKISVWALRGTRRNYSSANYYGAKDDSFGLRLAGYFQPAGAQGKGVGRAYARA